MSNQNDFDVMVIGAGTAGQTAAYDLIAEGYTVAVVEKSATPGGVCALHGCQAKKYFYELTELAAKSKHLQGLGITSEPVVSWSQISQEKNRFTSKIPENTIRNLKGNTVTYLEGEAFFINEKSISVGNKTYTPKHIILATGALPMNLPIKGQEHLILSDQFLALEALPERIIFVGGGFISFEFAHFAARLGAKEVTILEVMDRPLGPFDKDMVKQLCHASTEEGITIKTGITIEEISESANGFSVFINSGQTLDADLIVHGAGRVPDLTGLSLDKAGINYEHHGITVDNVMRSSNPKVYAIGDCANTVQLARVADREAHQCSLAIGSMETGEQVKPLDYSAVPAVLFTYPQLGMVGYTEEELISQNIKYWKNADSNLSWPTYRRIGMKNAAYKILVGEDNRFLGAHILSDNSTGLINCIKQAMLDRMTVEELYQANIMSPYPSRESDLIYMLEPLLD